MLLTRYFTYNRPMHVVLSCYGCCIAVLSYC